MSSPSLTVSHGEKAGESEASTCQSLLKGQELRHVQNMALQAIAQSILIADSRRRIIFANQAFEKLTGFSAKELIGNSCRIMHGKDTDPATVEKIRHCLNASESFEGEILNYRKDGTPFWNFLSISPLIDRRTGRLRFVGIQRDISEQKKMEDSLRRNEEEYRVIFEQSPIGKAELSMDFRFVRVNKAYCMITGYNAEELFHRDFPSITHPDDLKKDVTLATRLAAGQIPQYEMDKRYIRKDGKVIWVHLSVRLVRNSANQPHRYLAFAIDISDRKKAEETIRQSDEKQRRLLDNLRSGVVVHGPDTRIISANKVALELLGLSWDQLMGKSAHDSDWNLLREDGSPMPTEEFPANLALLPDRDIRDVVVGVPRTNPTEVTWLVCNAYAERDTKKRLNEVVVNFTDITAIRKASHALSLVNERLKLALRAGAVGIWDFDLEDNDLQWDEQMYLLYGVTPSGQKEDLSLWERHLHPEDLQKVMTEMEAALQPDARAFDTTFRIIRPKDGAVRHIRAIAVVIRDHSGKPLRMLGTNRDITESVLRQNEMRQQLEIEKQLRREALAGVKAKNEFLAVMSHEIRTPMNGILGFADLLAHAPELSESSREQALTIVSSGVSLLRILDDVLDFSRMEADHLHIEQSAFNPRDLFRGITDLFENAIRVKGIAWSSQVDPSVPATVLGDAGRLRQILLNLVGNAVKFTEWGRISILLRVVNAHNTQIGDAPKEGAMLHFQVSDTGSGIPEEALQKIFLPFTQADSSITRSHGGTGLGLAISRQLVKLMGGTLTVESKLNQGSVFSFSIPLLTDPVGTVKLEVDPQDLLDASFAKRYPLHLLLVEDDKINLKLIVKVMQKLGYHPLTACNGQECLKIREKELPNCILMDLQMPVMDGFEATQRIRELEKASGEASPCFISAVTANILPADKERCFQVGMNAYLNKPLKLQELARVLADAYAVVTAQVH